MIRTYCTTLLCPISYSDRVRLLVIGGTQFVGRHIVQAAISMNDDVTLFHRGRTNLELFPDAEHRLGDRDADMSSLATGEWDTTIDTSAYVPDQVRTLAGVLGGRGGRYVHISSVSAYAQAFGPGITEDSPLEIHMSQNVNEPSYGELKASCELAAHAYFGANSGEGGLCGALGVPVNIVRPTYVVGPFDHLGRFTWWVERIAKGGRVLAPGPKENSFQVIDARDLAAFVVLLGHGGVDGTFHTVSPTSPFTFEDFLKTVVREVGPPGTELVWINPDWLAKENLTIADLPLWEGTGRGRFESAADPSRAIAAGLRPRPIAQSISEVHEHELIRPTPLREPIGLDPTRERKLIDRFEKGEQE